MVDNGILFLAGFFTLMLIFTRYERQRKIEIDAVKENLYKTGLIAEGKVILQSNYFTTMLGVVLGVVGFQRCVNYKFNTKEGNEYFGKNIVNIFYETKIYFSNADCKIKIIYDPNNPTINLIYKNRENKEYNKKEK